MTSTRRELLMGAGCLATSAAAVAITPRKRTSLLRGAKLESIVPAKFDAWASRDVTDLVAPKIEGSLESRLYSQTLERIYEDGAGDQVMVLVAYGDSQTNELQLHRPEVCYPSFGFQIATSRAQQLDLGLGASLPVRELVAFVPGRRENIIYWTRLGDYLPTSESQQRLDRVKVALRGEIADGLLARFSLVSDDSASAFTQLRDFIANFIKATAPTRRPALVGPWLAGQLEAARV